MGRAKVSRNELVKAVKSKEKPEKLNQTFRLDIKVYKAFQKACESDGVTPTAIIEEFMRSYIGNL